MATVSISVFRDLLDRQMKAWKIPSAPPLTGFRRIEMRGPQTAADLGCSTGVCGEAARQQLVPLAADGLVVATSQTHGVGRPRQVWALTQAGNARFPDAHGQLAADLIRLIRTQLGDDALVRLIEARAGESRDGYAAALVGLVDLGKKVARLAEIRTHEGYMAAWLEDGASYLLVENHCPTCVATSSCEAFFRADLAMFRGVFGPSAAVEPTEHLINGNRRCAYRIAPLPVRDKDANRQRKGARKP